MYTCKSFLNIIMYVCIYKSTAHTSYLCKHKLLLWMWLITMNGFDSSNILTYFIENVICTDVYIQEYTVGYIHIHVEPEIPYCFHSFPSHCIALTKKYSASLHLASTKSCRVMLGTAIIHTIIMETQAQLCKQRKATCTCILSLTMLYELANLSKYTVWESLCQAHTA